MLKTLVKNNVSLFKAGTIKQLHLFCVNLFQDEAPLQQKEAGPLLLTDQPL